MTAKEKQTWKIEPRGHGKLMHNSRLILVISYVSLIVLEDAITQFETPASGWSRHMIRQLAYGLATSEVL